MTELAAASQISGIISGVVVVGGAIAACWKWNSIIQLVIRIAEGHPRRGDLDFAEEGLAHHPELQQTATLARRALDRANHRAAAERLGELQENARRRAANQSPARSNDGTSRTPSGERERPPLVQVMPSRVDSPSGRAQTPSRQAQTATGREVAPAERDTAPSRARERPPPMQVMPSRVDSPSGRAQTPSRHAHTATGREIAPAERETKQTRRAQTPSRRDQPSSSQESAQPSPSQETPGRGLPRPGFVSIQSEGSVKTQLLQSTAFQIRTNEQSAGQAVRPRRGLPSTKGGHTGKTSQRIDRLRPRDPPV